MFNIKKNYMKFIMAYHLYLKKMGIEKVEKLVTHVYDKNEYVIQIRNLKQVLNHGFILKKVHKVVKLNQNVWLKLYIDRIVS